MPIGFRSVETLRSGDSQGNRTVLRLTTHVGRQIHAIAVPQDWPSRTGPTWCYVFSEEGLNLIDAGAQGSFAELQDGLSVVGYSVCDIDRVIVTHSTRPRRRDSSRRRSRWRRALGAHHVRRPRRPQPPASSGPQVIPHPRGDGSGHTRQLRGDAPLPTSSAVSGTQTPGRA